jgi:hypothetical protein
MTQDRYSGELAFHVPADPTPIGSCFIASDTISFSGRGEELTVGGTVPEAMTAESQAAIMVLWQLQCAFGRAGLIEGDIKDMARVSM